jgi:hypothetical protein
MISMRNRASVSPPASHGGPGLSEERVELHAVAEPWVGLRERLHVVRSGPGRRAPRGQEGARVALAGQDERLGGVEFLVQDNGFRVALVADAHHQGVGYGVHRRDQGVPRVPVPVLAELVEQGPRQGVAAAGSPGGCREPVVAAVVVPEVLLADL